MKWVVKYKEVGSDKIRTTAHSGNKSRYEVIKLFELDENDIEWYEVLLSEER